MRWNTSVCYSLSLRTKRRFGSGYGAPGADTPGSEVMAAIGQVLHHLVYGVINMFTSDWARKGRNCKLSPKVIAVWTWIKQAMNVQKRRPYLQTIIWQLCVKIFFFSRSWPHLLCTSSVCFSPSYICRFSPSALIERDWSIDPQVNSHCLQVSILWFTCWDVLRVTICQTRDCITRFSVRSTNFCETAVVKPRFAKDCSFVFIHI